MPEFWKIQSKWTSAPASGFARNTALVNSAPGTTIASHQARADPSMIGNRNQNTWAGVRKIEESMDELRYVKPKRLKAKIEHYVELMRLYKPPPNTYAGVDMIAKISVRKVLMIFEKGALNPQQLRILN